MGRYGEKSGRLHDLREMIREHEGIADDLEWLMLEVDFDRYRDRWANETVRIGRMREELRRLEKKMYSGSYKKERIKGYFN